MENSIETYGNGGISFNGPKAVDLFQAVTLKSALNLYARCKMQPNRHWTPTLMLKAAGVYTGQKYKRGEYERAAGDLTLWIAKTRQEIAEEQAARAAQ